MGPDTFVPVRANAAMAERLARALLEGRRLRHTQGVANRAAQLAGAVPAEDRQLLIAAAWLHDIGYGTPVKRTGFHPLDGADFLRHNGWPDRLCALVAHHSGAEFAVRHLGLHTELQRYPNESSVVSDALTYADQTTDPDGEPVTIGDRLAEVLARHGTDSVQGRIHHLRVPYLQAIARRVEQSLTSPR